MYVSHFHSFTYLEKAREPLAIISDVFWSLPAPHFLGRPSPWLTLCPTMTRGSASNASFCSALMSSSSDCYSEGSRKWKVRRWKEIENWTNLLYSIDISWLSWHAVHTHISYLCIYPSILDFVLSILVMGIQHPASPCLGLDKSWMQDLSL